MKIEQMELIDKRIRQMQFFASAEVMKDALELEEKQLAAQATLTRREALLEVQKIYAMSFPREFGGWLTLELNSLTPKTDTKR